MNAFIVQVQRGAEWRNVTTVKIETRRYDPEGDRARVSAFIDAQRQLTAWQAYDGFSGFSLRIAEQVGREFVEARP